MDRIHMFALALLSGAALLTSGQVSAQGRGPSMKEIRARAPVDETAARAAKIAALEDWLRQLRGRFRVRITSSNEGPVLICGTRTGPNGSCTSEISMDTPVQATFEGSGECAAIGDGPGSSCRFEILGKTALMIPQTVVTFAVPDSGSIPFVPLAILYGLDPDSPGIRLMWVGGGGRAWEAAGSLERNAVRITCVSRSCFDMAYISSIHDGERIELAFVQHPGQRLAPISTVLELRRMPADAEEHRR